jgi:hypothetical protein
MRYVRLGKFVRVTNNDLWIDLLVFVNGFLWSYLCVWIHWLSAVVKFNDVLFSGGPELFLSDLLHLHPMSISFPCDSGAALSPKAFYIQSPPYIVITINCCFDFVFVKENCSLCRSVAVALEMEKICRFRRLGTIKMAAAVVVKELSAPSSGSR